ncbi:MAG: M23 family metallopeptidase [Myxococcales bacterium]|nr:M23 family metallopeptidase [Myxococcales bacterium]
MRAVARVLGARVVRLCTECVSPSTAASPQLLSVAESEVGEALLPATEAGASLLTIVVPVGGEGESRAGGVGQPAFAKSGWRLSGLRVLLSLIVILATSLLAFGGHQETYRVVAMPDLASELRPETELLYLSSDPLELVEPTAPILAEGDGWVHPVAGSEEQVPVKQTRLFRAMRPGTRPKECGRGHCGVDLDAPRGTPVVAIRHGIIEKVEADRHASGGRYVWIRHEDIGLRTEYFHLDRTAPDMRAGEPVEAGQWLGTLGRTGIEHSLPHLHFTVRDVSRNLRYVDPKPWLASAEILPLLDMRLGSLD